jgi:L-seryl-tRNA(Ser) seleniumtransferase
LRQLPAVNRFLDDPRIATFEGIVGRENVKRSIAQTLEDARRVPLNGGYSFESLSATIIDRLQAGAFESLVPVINATGILLHTNLGRAPLATAALAAIDRIGASYSNVEYDLERGERGSRYGRAVSLLTSLTGAQSALVVNNCAAAVLLALDTFAKGRDVIVARSQLIEIGGGFRLPDVLERSGARLVEVGATNKVYIEDYERAFSAHTALLMRAHPSNYAITGFTHEPEPEALAELGRRTGIPVLEDLGSGALCDLAQYGLAHERTVQEAIAGGIDLVTFSGDKLLGGPQAGIIVGSEPLIARMRANPLLRALRVDKLTLAALTETLRIWAAPERRNEIPLCAMLSATIEELRARATVYVKAIAGAEIVETMSYAGGGSLPQSALPSIGIALKPPGGATAAAAALRKNDRPVIARIEDGRLILDLRTVAPPEDRVAVAALKAL